MRVLLLQPKTDRKRTRREPPLSLALLAGLLKDEGHEPACLDLNLHKEKQLQATLDIFLPDAIGISFTSITLNAARLLATKVRKLAPDVTIIGGGYGMSCEPVQAMEHSDFDFGIVGEGESTLLRLLGHVEISKPVDQLKGVAWQRGDEVIVNEGRPVMENLDLLPFPAFEELELDEYLKVLPVFFTRGCSLACLHCIAHAAAGKGFRSKSPQRMVEELNHYVDEHEIKVFDFVDENFGADREKLEELCELIIRENLGIRWFLSQGLRADTVDKRLFEMMKRAGCEIVTIGVETVNPEALRIMRRDVPLEKVTEAIRAAKQTGLIVKTFNLVGCPGDTFEHVMQTIRYNIENDVDVPRHSVIYPFPGTELREWVQKNGRLNEQFEPVRILKGSIGSLRDIPYETNTMSLTDIYRASKIFGLEAGRQYIRNLLKRRFGKIGKVLQPIILRKSIVRIIQPLQRNALRNRMQVYE